MARIMAVALLIVAGVVAAAAVEVPSFETCGAAATSLGAENFVAQALGGNPTCVDAEDKATCCDQVRGLFAEGGAAEFCMCNEEFFSTVLTDLPTGNGINPSDYTDMLEVCGVPLAGQTTCPGVEVETPVEPVVQAQIKKKLIVAKLVKKALLAKAAGAAGRGAAGRGSAGRSRSNGVESSSTPPPAPVPAPTPPPVAPAGGKKAKKYVVAQPKKVVVAQPAPKKVTVAEPAPTPTAVPVATPKVTAPVVAPKVTAAGKR